MIRVDGHTLFGMSFNEGTMTGFTGHAFICILTESCLETGSMAFKAVEFTANFFPVLLEDG